MMNSLKNHFRNSNARGFTLLIAIILTSVVLSVGLALLDVSYKQITLSSSAVQSQYAFYAADSGLECALYWDSLDTFDYAAEPAGVVSPSVPSGTLSCEGQNTIPYYGVVATSTGASRTTTFSIPCGDGVSGDSVADITIQKFPSGATNLYSNGYNSCNQASPQRVQRGEEAHY